MAKKMLIDATHAEETRVVVVDGNKVEEFDFESENKRQLAGNIYLAKISRVEPSLQAAFVEYGGNRHGFLAFSEIHPDYYQIPVADREALLAEEKAYAAAQAAEEEEKPKRSRRRRRPAKTEAAAVTADDAVETREVASEDIPGMGVVELDSEAHEEGTSPIDYVHDTPVETPAEGDDAPQAEEVGEATEEAVAEVALPQAGGGSEPGGAEAEEASEAADEAVTKSEAGEDTPAAADDEDTEAEDGDDYGEAMPDATERDADIESVADEDVAEEIRQPRKPRPKRYRIQEVIKVRQILLVQVVKEERGNKGAALTTYLSLAGRYCVLMPNTARGGGISRKITNAPDRKKLKEIASTIEVPEGAGLIIRTAGAKRTKSEIKRDYEYLQRMWEQIRELTLKSIAPSQIYEEGNLIKRSIRDLYNREIDEVLVEGEAGYRVAKDFMKMIMPSHAKNVKNYTGPMPLFARHQVESYLSAMFNPTVQLRSGGYIVIGVTEALVAIDVNSGRATKEGSIEETALKTNLEAAEEVARQLRLRDLAGLIVIDFIDMEERRNNSAVEKRFKERLKTDRARIQVGRISGFGLMEMSRQRLRPGMIEATTQPCAACHGTGLVRSDDNLALNILRQLEEEGTRRRNREVLLKAPVGIINFLMNQKREHIAQIEGRYGLSVRIEADPFMISPDFSIEKFKTATRQVVQTGQVVSVDASIMEGLDEPVEEEELQPVAEAEDSDAPKKRRRRRRRRRGGGGEQAGEQAAGDASVDGDAVAAIEDGGAEPADSGLVEVPESETEERPRKRRRRPRSKNAEAAEAGAVDATAEAETVTEAAETGETAEESAAAAESDAKPEKPKRKRAPRTRKKKDDGAEAVTAEPPESDAPGGDEGAAAETGAEAPTAGDDVAPATESAQESEPVVEPAQEPEPVVAAAEPEPAPVADEEPVTEAEPDPVAEVVEEVAATPEPEPAEVAPAKPKRRGWWSMGS